MHILFEEDERNTHIVCVDLTRCVLCFLTVLILKCAAVKIRRTTMNPPTTRSAIKQELYSEGPVNTLKLKQSKEICLL